MATCGLIPVVSTFAFLLALRAADPLRSLVAYNALNLKLVGGYAGLSDYADGASHQAVEDIAVMRAIPGIAVVVPSDLTETEMATAAMLHHPGPVYLRLSRQPVGRDFGPAHPFAIGRGIVLRQGKDVALAATGTMVAVAMAAAMRLADAGIAAMVLDLHTVKPLDEELVAAAARETGALVTIEEHSIVGGLGEAVAAVLAQRCPVPVWRCGVPDRFGESGDYNEILGRAGLSVAHVVNAAKAAMVKRDSVGRAPCHHGEHTP
jgi:transketolase